jgi:hypothetical protein
MAEKISDLIEGGAAIGAELGLPAPRAFRLLERGALSPPAFKLLGKWYARRSTLHAHIERLERGEAA